MDEQKQKLIERIRQAQNVLVTVSANPSVDQLSAAIGLTLALNKLDKHGTAVFSGQVPSTIEFLKPEDTLEKNTDSLRDFIIALDKSKADKLRYKVEDQVVRIFITPYRTSLSQADLNFSQGDFNVDVVIALGVTEQQDLDTAITAHGRILHDATVASVTTTGQGSLGTINWVDPSASSLSEMVEGLVTMLDKKILDNQIATALLTGIVASTERFSNDKTTPKTMSASAELMVAGANQQLIATQLATPEPPVEQPVAAEPIPESDADTAVKKEAGTLEIEHESFQPAAPEESERTPEEPERPQIDVDEDGGLHLAGQESVPEISHVRGVGSADQPVEGGGSEVKRELMMAPPQLGDNAITANSTPETDEPAAEELTLPAVSSPLLSHNESVLSPLPAPSAPMMPASTPDLPPPPVLQAAPPAWQPPGPAAEPPKPVEPTPPPAPVEPPTTPPPVVEPTFTPPSVPAPTAPPAPYAPQGPAFTPGATLAQIERSAGSPHVHISDDGALSTVPGPNPAANGAVAAADDTATNVDDARDAVAAAYNGAGMPANSLQPIAALNAQPLGPDLRPDAGVPASDAPVLAAPAAPTVDMPMASNPFGPGQSFAPPAPTAPAPSAFPGTPLPSSGALPPPPVPPPMVPPM